MSAGIRALPAPSPRPPHPIWCVVVLLLLEHGRILVTDALTESPLWPLDCVAGYCALKATWRTITSPVAPRPPRIEYCILDLACLWVAEALGGPGVLA